MNLTGGNPITYEGFSEMHERLHPWFRVPRLLAEAVAEEGPTGRVWDVPARGEEVFVPEDRRARIEERITAAYLGLAAWTAADGAISVPDLDMSCHLALAVVHPFGLMRTLGKLPGFRNSWPPTGSGSLTSSIPPGSPDTCPSGHPGRSPGWAGKTFRRGRTRWRC